MSVAILKFIVSCCGNCLVAYACLKFAGNYVYVFVKLKLFTVKCLCFADKKSGIVGVSTMPLFVIRLVDVGEIHFLYDWIFEIGSGAFGGSADFVRN